MKRTFISVYFRDTKAVGRKRRDVTLAFRADDPLYVRCRNVGSKRLRELLGCDSYADIVEASKEEGRTVSNYLKSRLKKALGA